MADSLANTLNFLTQQRQIPAASPEFLASAQNPNIRNFSPGNEPQFQNALLAKLFGGGSSNAPQSLAIPNARPEQGNQGALANIMRMIGLGSTADPLLSRQQKIDDILKQAN